MRDSAKARADPVSDSGNRAATCAVSTPSASSLKFAVCTGYLEFARKQPGRYRTMFGGLWMPDLEASYITEADMQALGRSSMRLLADALGDCAAAGIATSTDPSADAVALWLGMHGLAHQRSVTVAFPWPRDITERLIVALAHLTDGGGRPRMQ